MDDNAEWVTVSEAARRLGVSRQAIRGRITRGTIPSQTDNHGHPLVKAIPPLPVTMCDAREGKVTPSTIPPPAIAELTGPGSLDEVRQMLGEQSERMERQHAAALAALERSHTLTVQLLVERIDAAELRAEQTQEQLAELVDRMSRPWWTKWVGSSKRSTLR
jgi:hypothetical protein